MGVAGGGGKGDSLKRGIRFSHFARMESSQVLEAAILDLLTIFQIKVSQPSSASSDKTMLNIVCCRRPRC